VRQTMMILRTLEGGMPESARHPLAVVSRDVTQGYQP
jgi:hypothetical protein